LIQYSILTIFVVFFVITMGGSNFGASFAAAYGSKIIEKKRAQLLFCLFVFLGAVLVGNPVSNTLGSKIIPVGLMDTNIVIIIMFVSSVSMLIANLLHVPQSTSLVTVFSIAGAGFYFKQIYTDTILYMLSFWILLPAIGYILSYMLGKLVYPPRKENYWIHEKIVHHGDRLKVFVLIASCYNAFSIGTNNVANAVGPLAGAGIITHKLGLIALAPLFGIGSLAFHSTLKKTGQKIVPIGILSATIICIVTGTLMIIASCFGIPQSFVMIKVACIIAISSLKDGHKVTFANSSTKKTYISWIVMPIIAFISSFAMTSILYFILKKV